MSALALGFILMFLLGPVMWPLEMAGKWLEGRRSARKTAAGPGPEQLSPKEARRLSEWLADWRRLRDDGPPDHGSVEDAIAGIYERRGPPHLSFRWVDSPWAALAAGVSPPGEGGNPSTGPLLPWSYFHASYDELKDPRFAARGDRIREAFSRLPSTFLDMRTIMSTLLEGRPLLLPIAGAASATLNDSAPFLACCRDVLGVRYNDLASRQLALGMGTARCFRWWWLDDDVCVVSERPTVMRRDDRGLLHHPGGAAVRFRDGFAVHAWHGTAVPASWMTSPETLRPREALHWPNLEQRGAALEIIGWKRVMEDLQPRTIDTAADPAVGQLVEAELPLSGPARFLRVRCGTGREFVLAVPRHMQTALEANAWTYGLSAHEYQLEVRT